MFLHFFHIFPESPFCLQITLATFRTDRDEIYE